MCRRRDCRLEIGQEVNVTCTVHKPGADECDPHEYPVSIHLIDIEGDRKIHQNNDGRVMSGFQRLERLDKDCGLQLTFIATAEANNVVLQCVVRKSHIIRFSQAHVVGVKDSLTGMMTHVHTECCEMNYMLQCC